MLLSNQAPQFYYYQLWIEALRGIVWDTVHDKN